MIEQARVGLRWRAVGRDGRSLKAVNHVPVGLKLPVHAGTGMKDHLIDSPATRSDNPHFCKDLGSTAPLETPERRCRYGSGRT